MKTVDALKDLYVALGGDEGDVAELVTIPAILSKIAEIIPDAIAHDNSGGGGA